jgi:haloalkane dehalogenase
LTVLYPFRGKAFATPAGRLHTLDEGSGPPIVFLHGNPTWSFMWRELILGLRERHRCLAVDHLGCGLSDKPEAGPYTLEAHIERTTAWLRATLTETFDLVVHDWGGAIGLGVAGRMGDQVRSLTLLNTAAFPFARIPLRIAVCRWPWIGERLVRGQNAFVRAAGRMTTTTALSPAVRAGYAFPYDSWANRVAVHRFVEDIPMHPRHPSWPALKETERAIGLFRDRPVQLVWGLRDWCFTPAILAAWRERLPNAMVFTYPNAGHLVQEDEPQAVLDRIRAMAGRG